MNNLATYLEFLTECGFTRSIEQLPEILYLSNLQPKTYMVIKDRHGNNTVAISVSGGSSSMELTFNNQNQFIRFYAG